MFAQSYLFNKIRTAYWLPLLPDIKINGNFVLKWFYYLVNDDSQNSATWCLTSVLPPQGKRSFIVISRKARAKSSSVFLVCILKIIRFHIGPAVFGSFLTWKKSWLRASYFTTCALCNRRANILERPLLESQMRAMVSLASKACQHIVIQQKYRSPPSFGKPIRMVSRGVGRIYELRNALVDHIWSVAGEGDGDEEVWDESLFYLTMWPVCILTKLADSRALFFVNIVCQI